MKRDLWTEKEIKVLYKELDKAKGLNKTKKEVFDAHADKFIRSYSAASSFYYNYNKKIREGRAANPLNVLIIHKPQFEKEIKAVEVKKAPIKQEQPKVLTMPKKELITDSEINALFLGLVKMIKNVAKAEAENEILKISQEVVKKNKQLKTVNDMNTALKKEIEKLLLKEDKKSITEKK